MKLVECSTEDEEKCCLLWKVREKGLRSQEGPAYKAVWLTTAPEAEEGARAVTLVAIAHCALWLRNGATLSR